MDFLKNLEDLTKLYEDLIAVMELEREALIGADLAALTQQNLAKENILFKIRASEKKRQLMAMAFAKDKGVPTTDVRLLALADRCEFLGEKQLALQMRTRHALLQMQVERAAELNKENEIYASSALRILQGAVKDITQSVTEKPTYGKRGQMAGSSETQAGNFIKREA